MLLAVIGALLTFGLFFAGFHDTPEKMHGSRWIAFSIGTIATVIALVLAMRAQRAAYPANKQWTYGSALGTGVLTGLWSAVFGAVFMYLYVGIINPNFRDVLHQMQVHAMEAKGLSADRIAQSERVLNIFLSPLAVTIAQFVNGVVGTVILSLIVAIFVRKPLAAVPGSDADAAVEPPAL